MNTVTVGMSSSYRWNVLINAPIRQHFGGCECNECQGGISERDRNDILPTVNLADFDDFGQPVHNVQLEPAYEPRRSFWDNVLPQITLNDFDEEAEQAFRGKHPQGRPRQSPNGRKADSSFADEIGSGSIQAGGAEYDDDNCESPRAMPSDQFHANHLACRS